MLLTKHEAAQKWCPLAQSEVCMADGCAMWRWAPIINPSNGARRFMVADNPAAKTEQEAGTKPEHCHGWEFHPCAEDPAGWIEPEAAANRRRRGYCGLAGVPSL
ncbi:MAG: hypothetical protein DI596_10960 [Azospira oryzae]|uniref:Uncharacterized protein n=1 Tax=Pelomicrobium methylotrophicum TaxID=2602750 RepID=A0A5C7EIF3_9PROT|nr:hypothetical protein [Pelomicrobium methylotrophicum]PZP55881.1 MAG: hypothetical protein DI596_10960 [Azospira oryzae]PZP78177.1 MAG: hypothetical protein DI593_10960 [Azospira oryzae]TXF11153.1 hypothetical protein FR698_11600 [Pelomicrobium methylotrophicum]